MVADVICPLKQRLRQVDFLRFSAVTMTVLCAVAISRGCVERRSLARLHLHVAVTNIGKAGCTQHNRVASRCQVFKRKRTIRVACTSRRDCCASSVARM